MAPGSVGREVKPAACLILLLVLAVPVGAHGTYGQLELTNVKSAYAPRAPSGPSSLETHTVYAFDVANHGAETAVYVEARVNFGLRGFDFKQRLADLAPGESRHVELDFRGTPYPYACVEVVSEPYHSDPVCGLVGDVVLP